MCAYLHTQACGLLLPPRAHNVAQMVYEHLIQCSDPIKMRHNSLIYWLFPNHVSGRGREWRKMASELYLRQEASESEMLDGLFPPSNHSQCSACLNHKIWLPNLISKISSDVIPLFTVCLCNCLSYYGMNCFMLVFSWCFHYCLLDKCFYDVDHPEPKENGWSTNQIIVIAIAIVADKQQQQQQTYELCR